jgi:hypothetical protein
MALPAQQAVPKWKRQGFDSQDSARQYRREAYGTNSSRQQPRTAVYDRTPVKQSEVNWIDPVIDAIDTIAGRESAHAYDGDQQHRYGLNTSLLIRLTDAVVHEVTITSTFSVFNRLRYRIQFDNGLSLALTQAQLLKVVLETPVTDEINEYLQIIALKRGSRRSSIRENK